jgi:predicted metal-dependent HD superfamily phosphohydrolase
MGGARQIWWRGDAVGVIVLFMDEVPSALVATLQEAYRTPPRAYHSWAHVEEVMRHWQAVASGPGWKQPREVQLSVLFHDAVYLAGRKDNEQQSAVFALAQVQQHLAGEQLDLERIDRLIRLTAKHGSLSAADVDPEAALFLDCDMAILGSEPVAFDRYDAQIREEFSGVPSVLYSLGRRRFLRRLLDSPRIFLSDFFQERFESAARANLRRALGKDE